MLCLFSKIVAKALTIYLKKTKMNNKIILTFITIILLIVISLAGALSLDFTKSFDAVNQYGDTIKMYGSGIYARDSYFKAPISIGTDFAVLLILVPAFIFTLVKKLKNNDIKSDLNLLALYAVAFYYATSVSLGITYNAFHLIYIALFGCSLFGIFLFAKDIKKDELNFDFTKGIKAFLILTGIALIVAWLPDIIQSLVEGKSLSHIDVYTTELTYVLDMGVIGPLCFICLRLIIKGDKLSVVILAALLKLYIFVGFMVISQTIFQILSGYELTIIEFVSKSITFVLLSGFALYFDTKLYKGLKTSLIET